MDLFELQFSHNPQILSYSSVYHMCTPAYTHTFLKLIYFWLCWGFVAAHGFSLVVARGGCYSLVAVHRFHIAVASLVAEHRL